MDWHQEHLKPVHDPDYHKTFYEAEKQHIKSSISLGITRQFFSAIGFKTIFLQFNVEPVFALESLIISKYFISWRL